jgi:hypothetical protein
MSNQPPLALAWQCSDAVTSDRAIASTRQKPRRWRVRDRSACSLPVSTASSRSYVWSPNHSRARAGGQGQSARPPRLRQSRRLGALGFRWMETLKSGARTTVRPFRALAWAQAAHHSGQRKVRLSSSWQACRPCNAPRHEAQAAARAAPLGQRTFVAQANRLADGVGPSQSSRPPRGGRGDSPSRPSRTRNAYVVQLR